MSIHKELPAVRRTQPITIGQNLFNNQCPIATMVTKYTTTTTTRLFLLARRFDSCRAWPCGELKFDLIGSRKKSSSLSIAIILGH